MKTTVIRGGGGDSYYELGLLSGLAANGVDVDYIGSDYMKDSDILKNEHIVFYNLRGDQNPDVPITAKVHRVAKYYLRLIQYALNTDSRILHIQWLDKVTCFDRTILNVYFKMLGKKLVFTAHNVNAGERDQNDTLINRITLSFMYHLMDKIIVHTVKMKVQLVNDFNIKGNKVSVIPYGINNLVFNSGLTKKKAKEELGLEDEEKTLLFFGIIKPYKGLEFLALALAYLKEKCPSFRLVIAGKIDTDCHGYWKGIERIIEKHNLNDLVIKRLEFIPDDEIELYFKSADVLILPYKHIFQSGILFIAYNFGLPVIVTDVGSLREYIVEGKTGFVCKPQNYRDLAEKIDNYFHSDLYENLESTRKQIMKYANKEYSWDAIGEKTRDIYSSLL